MNKQTNSFLKKLNDTYYRLHYSYENLFWTSYMGDRSINKKMNDALAKRDAFRANSELLKKVIELQKTTSKKQAARLANWRLFFEKYQTPPDLADLKAKIANLESKIRSKRSSRKEGYQDPSTKKMVKASEVQMRVMMRTEKNEAIRKACFEALEKLSLDSIDEYIALVDLLNKYAKSLGYKTFYDYKIMTEEGMTVGELSILFDSIYEKTKYGFKNVRDLEKKKPGLRKPWNLAYILGGDFTAEEDQYFQFDDALLHWGRSFSALGIDYQKSELKLDLLDRKGKWNNGFCHWPKLVHFVDGKRMPGSSNFTCTAIFGQVGSGSLGINTLFHEGGHAAHMLNSEQTEVCLNTEYPPASTAWAETQSMFLDSLFDSVEWRTRYAKNKEGKAYPLELYERKVRELHSLMPLNLMSILYVSNFEREIYSQKKLDREKVITIARKMYRKYFDRSEDSTSILNVPHIYSWESICSYHGYGLAQLALSQWRSYFYEKYGYIVDNPAVGKEMRIVWKKGSSKTFKEFVIEATGKPLSADAFVHTVTRSVENMLSDANKRIVRLDSVKRYAKPVKLNALIKMVDGKKVITDNRISFENMAERYKKWLHKKA